MIEDIYRLFLSCPQANGALVFEQNTYYGVLFKKDVELAIKSGEYNFNIAASLVIIPISELEENIFSARPRSKTRIPSLDIMGKNLESFSYEEFVSEFHPGDFRISLIEILNDYEFPLLILNRFKTAVYANPAAEKIFVDPKGKRMSTILEDFIIEATENRITLIGGGSIWNMQVSHSQNERSLYFIYQFIPLNHNEF
ncbi:MAG: hypothetical protein ACRC9L_02205 [Brevinema sp.]